MNQTYRNLEIIVVDGMSNYDVAELLTGFNDDRIVFYQNQNNGNIARNRNFGLNKRSSDIVAFCDDDDVWDPSKIEKQLNQIDYNQGGQVLYSDRILLQEDGQRKYQRSQEITNINDFLGTNPITFSSVLIYKIGEYSFNESEFIVASEDFYLYTQLLNNGYTFTHINEALLEYRFSINSKFNQNIWKSYLRYNIVLFSFVITSKESELNLVKFFYFSCLRVLKSILKKRIV
jgi:teichuronic acid biosynthesis glycosyltransferase TuaG